jgi:hypothetical protein
LKKRTLSPFLAEFFDFGGRWNKIGNGATDAKSTAIVAKQTGRIPAIFS